jgi:hypothetical protein
MLSTFFDEIPSGKGDGSAVSNITSVSLSMTEQIFDKSQKVLEITPRISFSILVSSKPQFQLLFTRKLLGTSTANFKTV